MGVRSDVAGFFRSLRGLPAPAVPDTSDVPARGSRYGDAYGLSVIPGKQVLADEGSYFVATNPTPGTGVAYALTTAFNDTTGALLAISNNQPLGGKRIFLDYLRLILTAAPATTVGLHLLAKVDTKDRTPTGGNAAIVPVNCNMDDGSAFPGTLNMFNAAAMTVPASGANARTVARMSLATSLGIVNDSYVFQFGAEGQHGTHPGLTAVRATAPAVMTANGPPIAIGPQQWLVLYLWWLTATTTAPSFEYEVGMFAR